MNDQERLVRQAVWRHPIYFLAFGFASGLAPYAPGTWGTLIAIPFYGLLSQGPWLLYLFVTCFFFLGGIWLCQRATDDLGLQDYPGIVWDEICGYLFTMLFIPFSWQGIVIGFALFRFFDILKPYPIKKIEALLPNGFGIMFDDLLAAIPAGLLTFLFVSYL